MDSRVGAVEWGLKCKVKGIHNLPFDCSGDGERDRRLISAIERERKRENRLGKVSLSQKYYSKKVSQN